MKHKAEPAVEIMNCTFNCNWHDLILCVVIGHLTDKCCTLMYLSKHRLVLIVAFTEAPFGNEKSVIRRHLPGWCFLGIIPK